MLWCFLKLATVLVEQILNFPSFSDDTCMFIKRKGLPWLQSPEICNPSWNKNYKQLRKEKRRKCISSVWVTTCFRPSLGSDSDTSSGRTDTSATTIKISTFHCETLPMFRKPPAEKGKIQAVLLSKHCKLSEIIPKYCKLSKIISKY